MRIFICAMRRKLTEGKEPPHATGLIVSPSHCFVERKKCDMVKRAQGDGESLTSSALATHRGSSTPISHWCSAAIVNAASRCALGMHVPS